MSEGNPDWQPQYGHEPVSNQAPNDSNFEATPQHTAPAVEGGENAPKKPGPKPMTDEPTKRFEGQLYVRQVNELGPLLNRLIMENKAVPGNERRRFTLNTLVRVGAEIVLDHGVNLHGKTEAEVLESLRSSIEAEPSRRRAADSE